MLVLGIESSCDETAAAIVSDGKLLSNIIASQIKDHSAYGGVVPEIASRKHLEAITYVISRALAEAEVSLGELEGIAVTRGPGLIGSLLVGLSAAKALAYGLGLPFVGVNHLEGHIMASFLSEPRPQFPFAALVVSGGHTNVYRVGNYHDFQLLGQTRDDAAGEAFDKCARAMGLGYPGGPIIDKLARDGDPGAIHFPRAKVGDTLDFSFSGLKTAVIRYAQSMDAKMRVEDIAAGFQQAVVDVLVDHTFRAVGRTDVKQVLIAGGVAANSALQSAIKSRGERLGIAVTAPPPVLCTDNAAMAAGAAYYVYERGESAGLDMDCFASEPLGISRQGA